jgi:hypothetical protein
MSPGFPRLLSRKYGVIREERSIFYEVIVSAILRKILMNLFLIMTNYLDRGFESVALSSSH